MADTIMYMKSYEVKYIEKLKAAKKKLRDENKMLKAQIEFITEDLVAANEIIQLVKRDIK